VLQTWIAEMFLILYPVEVCRIFYKHQLKTNFWS